MHFITKMAKKADPVKKEKVEKPLTKIEQTLKVVKFVKRNAGTIDEVDIKDRMTQIENILNGVELNQEEIEVINDSLEEEDGDV